MSFCEQIKGRYQLYNSLPPGTLLGLVPGVVYDGYKEIKNKGGDTHFFRFDGTLFNYDERVFYPVTPGLSLEDIGDRITDIYTLSKAQIYSVRNPEKGGYERVNGSDINPYAVGHLINHVPANSSVNVTLVDFFIPKMY